MSHNSSGNLTNPACSLRNSQRPHPLPKTFSQTTNPTVSLRESDQSYLLTKELWAIALAPSGSLINPTLSFKNLDQSHPLLQRVDQPNVPKSSKQSSVLDMSVCASSFMYILAFTDIIAVLLYSSQLLLNSAAKTTLSAPYKLLCFGGLALSDPDLWCQRCQKPFQRDMLWKCLAEPDTEPF